MRKLATFVPIVAFAVTVCAPIAYAQINQGVNATPGSSSGNVSACSVPGCVHNPQTGVCYCNAASCQSGGCYPGANPTAYPTSASSGIGSGGSGGGINSYYIQSYGGQIIGAINGIIVPVLLAIAFLFFIWGVVNYFIFGATSEEKQREGRQFILWSVIGFAVIFSIWGLVGVVGSTFGLTAGGTAPPYPTL